MHGSNDKFIGFSIDLSTYRNPEVHLVSLLLYLSTIASTATSVSTWATTPARARTTPIGSMKAASPATVSTRNVKISPFPQFPHLIPGGQRSPRADLLRRRAAARGGPIRPQ